jgi:hypothetical protein
MRFATFVRIPLFFGLAAVSLGCEGSGSVSWLVQPGDEAADVRAPLQLASGDLLVTGSALHSPTAGDADPLLEWLSPEGAALRTTTPPMTRLRLDPTTDGRLAFAGEFSGSGKGDEIGLMDEGGDVESSLPAPGAAFAHFSPEGGFFYVLGGVASLGVPEDAFVKKIDAEGNEVWAHHRNELDYNRIYTAAFPQDGGVIVTGPTGTTFPILHSYLTRIDANGEELWSREIEGTILLDIEQDPDTGVLYATGYDGSNRIVIGAVDADGKDVFWKKFDGASPGSAYASGGGWTISVRRAVDSSPAEVLVGGLFADAIDFGLGPLEGDDDAFLLAMTTEGEPLWQMMGSSDGVDIFFARYGEDGNILAALSCSTGGAFGSERIGHVGGRTFPLRGIIDSAVMRIIR